MGIQLISYGDRIVAVCTARRAFLTEAHGTDPSPRFVLAMCLYAGQILNGHWPGPYRERDARAFARNVLIPAELVLSLHR